MGGPRALFRDLTRILVRARPWRPSHVTALSHNRGRRPHDEASGTDDSACVDAAAGWLTRAQDATGDGGVAEAYTLWRGWNASYAETTGYLIPTLLQLAVVSRVAEFEARAARAIAFLLNCQLECGAFPGGTAEQLDAGPSVFNSAQVICGLVAWHRRSHDARALDAAVRAGEWLASVQDADGAWRRHVYNGVATTYTAHASCWLAELGSYAGVPRLCGAARKHLEWTLSMVDRETGWFDCAGFTARQHADRVAVTHTIAYTLWGVLRSAELLDVEAGRAAVQRAATAIAQRLHPGVDLPAILNWRWEACVNYSCVPALAQMALVWLRLYELTSDRDHLLAADAVIASAKGCQVIRSSNPGIRGALPGSNPIWKDYMPLSYPNWSVKFFIDAILERRRLFEDSREP
jgi:hypothetical protein